MVEYRPLPDDRQAVFHEYTSYAFRPEDGPPEYDPDAHDTPRANLGSRRGIFPDGAPRDADPLSVCRHYWLDARVRGDVHPAPGLSAVATPPEHRRTGHVRRLLGASLEEYRERGGRFSILWPFRYRFYRSYGWETANRRLTIRLDSDVLSFAEDALEVAGAYRRLEADDHADLAPVYEAHLGDYALAIDRDEDWWRHKILTSWEDDPFVYAWERDGRVRGYLVYDVDGDWDDRTLRVEELAAVDHEAYLALLRFCYNHDSQASTVRLHEPADSPLLDLATDPEDVECALETGPMVRIVDVAETLSALSYPAVDADLTVAVSDPLVEWNDGRFALRASGGSATCEPTAADPDVSTDVGALSQLVVGYRAASTLERVGRLEIPEGTGPSGRDAVAESDGDAVDALDRLFPKTSVYLGDGF